MVHRLTLRLVPVVSSACLLALLGCTPPKDDEAGTDVTPPSSDTPPAIELATAGPIQISKAVPADAAAVVVIRAPESLFGHATKLMWFGSADPTADAAMRAEIDAFLRDRIGVQLTSTSSVTLFYADKPERMGVVLDGVEGELRGPEHGRHGDTIVRSIDEELLAASRGSQLLLGNEAALQQMLDSLDGKVPALVDDSGELATLLRSESTGASFAAVAELAKLPPDIVEEATEIGIARGYLGLGAQGVHAVAVGTPAGMAATAKLIELAIANAQAELDKEKQDAIAGDDVVMGVAAITGAHMGKRIATILTPKVEGGRMSIDVPLSVGDTGPVVVAVLGVMAVVAVPALQKYMRRAKTAEAKTQLAKLFDATSSYFKAEHVVRGADPTAALAMHQCPNDGRLYGEAGITPPLEVNCNEGPGGRCIPAQGGGGAGYYDIAVWTDNPVWNALNYMQEQGHYFHYNFRWANDGEGYGRCMFTVQAFADLDDDGVFSTYERSGAADIQGVNAAIGLYVDNEVE
jgi:hypothetical protein